MVAITYVAKDLILRLHKYVNSAYNFYKFGYDIVRQNNLKPMKVCVVYVHQNDTNNWQKFLHIE